VDDTQTRLGLLEKAVTEIRAILPFLATKEDLQNLKAELGGQIQSVEGKFGKESQSVKGELGVQLQSVEGTLGKEIQSVKGELGAQIQAVEGTLGKDIQSVRADMNAMETRILKWMVTTTIACAALAFSIAKFVH
jgi:hypothetical protein